MITVDRVAVQHWQFEQFERIGFNDEDCINAVFLGIDYHEAEKLVKAGCDPKTAIKILEK